jgi:hypothetical protein
MNYWYVTNDRDLDAISLYKRHYSARKYKDGRSNLRAKGFLGPGEKLVLITAKADALFAWVYSKLGHRNRQRGVCCTIFRNEGDYRSSDMIREAVELARQRWPGKRLFTYVDPQKIRSTNPGMCFLKASWKRIGKTKGNLIILEYINAINP